jgi:hypothetical protein
MGVSTAGPSRGVVLPAAAACAVEDAGAAADGGAVEGAGVGKGVNEMAW